MNLQIWLPLGVCLIYTALGLNPVPLGFPSVWDGDHYQQAECEVIKKPPSWVDGFLFAQTAGSYGEQSNPNGEKATHLFDAMAAVSVFEVSPHRATFTGAYYPNRPFKIWQFNDRDFKKSKVAWYASFSDINASALEMWSHIPTDEGLDVVPAVDFWKVGTQIVAGTEQFNPLGFSFNPPTVDKFELFYFKDTDERILKGQMIGIHMPMHEHVDQKTGLIWNALLAINVANQVPTFHEMIFTVDEKGTRTVQGTFDFSPIDYTKCSQDGSYSGPVSGNGIVYPRYMHTVTATENYLILPMSSVTFRTCQIVFHPPTNPDNLTVYTPIFATDYNETTPVVFLIFDKKNKKFLDPIEFKSPLFFTHQFNSYETNDGKIITDLLGYDRDIYRILTPDNLLTHGDHPETIGQAARFTIDTVAKTVTTRPIIPFNDKSKVEFPQINHKFEGKQYKHGYIVQFPFFNGNQILKIDMDTPDGSKNKAFRPSDSVSFSEPYFAPRPGGTDEDDGVLVVRALDSSINKTRIYILDAKTMEKVGELLAPYYVPFGLHERFYSKQQLGMTSGASKSGRWFW